MFTFSCLFTFAIPSELSISLEEAEALRQEEMEGVRERFSKTVAELNDQIGELKNDVRGDDFSEIVGPICF